MRHSPGILLLHLTFFDFNLLLQLQDPARQLEQETRVERQRIVCVCVCV